MDTIKTERLVLRGLCDNDAKDVFEILSDKETANRFGMEAIKDMEMAEFMTYYQDQFGITVKGSDKVIGIIQMYRTNWKTPLNYHLGYVLSAKERGHHYMQEAVNAVCDYLFEQRFAKSVTLQIRPDNGPSRAVAAACGFCLYDELPESEREYTYFGDPLDEFNKLRPTKTTYTLKEILPPARRAAIYRAAA